MEGHVTGSEQIKLISEKVSHFFVSSVLLNLLNDACGSTTCWISNIAVVRLWRGVWPRLPARLLKAFGRLLPSSVASCSRRYQTNAEQPTSLL